MARLPKLASSAASMLAALALMVGSAACAQEEVGSSEKYFIAATPDDILGAVQACETSKTEVGFDISQMRAQGWRQLRPPGGMSDGQVMFGNRPSGASITIGANDDEEANKVCVIIGWVDDQETAEATKGLVARDLALTLEIGEANQTKANIEGWEYSFYMFTRPEVTDQVRMIVVIASVQDRANS